MCTGWHHEYHAIRQQLHVYNSSGILLHGPAGCGKTLLVQKIAAEMRASLHTVVASSVFDAVTGDYVLPTRMLFGTGNGTCHYTQLPYALPALHLSEDELKSQE